MFLTIKSIFLGLSVFALINCGKSDDCVVGISTLGLCQEFQAIQNLAPHAAVINIIRTHMQNDSKFRRAVKFMQSPLFVSTTQQIDSTSVYQNILAQFTNVGVNTTDIDSIVKIFNCLIIPLVQIPWERSADVAVQSRSLDTVLVEINNLIPRDSLVNTLTTHLANNTQYASFYKVVRRPSFQTMVLRGFRSTEVARQIRVLLRGQIDLSQMVQYAFNLFALGPQI